MDFSRSDLDLLLVDVRSLHFRFYTIQSAVASYTRRCPFEPILPLQLFTLPIGPIIRYDLATAQSSHV
jgi:hypothetical protein